MTRRMSALMTGLALATTSGIAFAQAPPAAQPAAAQPAQAGDRKPGDLPGPIDSLEDLQDSGRMLFKMADTNNDGQISQKEATDVLNLTVGGFFFRADANGDGTLSADEARQARESILQQQPLLRYILQKGKAQAAQGGNAAAGTNPAQAVGNLLDANNDKQIQATEVRQFVQTAVQGVFATADTNRDNQLSPTEINAAIIGAFRTAAQASFQAADADHNGSLSREEFDRAIVEPANMIFAMMDINGDGQLSQEEAQRARQVLGSQIRALRTNEPANSARNLLRTGASPDQVAPVPAVPAPTGTGTGAAGATPRR